MEAMTESIVPDAATELATGWEPDGAVADTLIRRAVHLHASWPVTVAQAIGRPWRRTADWAGGFVADRGALSNPVVLLVLQLTSASWSARLRSWSRPVRRTSW